MDSHADKNYDKTKAELVKKLAPKLIETISKYKTDKLSLDKVNKYNILQKFFDKKNIQELSELENAYNIKIGSLR